MDRVDQLVDHDELETDSEDEGGGVRQESTPPTEENPRGRLAIAWKIRITGSRVPGLDWGVKDSAVIRLFLDSNWVNQCGIQREKGKKHGVIHYQGVFILNERKRFKTLENLLKPHLPDVLWDKKQGYLQPTNSAAANKYVMKVDTRMAGPWYKGEAFEEIAKETVYKISIQLRFWQKRICKIIEMGANDRNIWWFWEPCGGLGKTTFQKWIFQNYEGVTLSGGKAADMKNGIIRYIEKVGTHPKIILINLPMTFDHQYFCPHGVEEVKDMFFFSGKYGEKGSEPIVCGKPPQVFIFANREFEDEGQLAVDRWRIVRLPDGPGKDTQLKKLDWSIEGPIDEFME